MKLFVWDFHGVLEKGTENLTVVLTNEVLSELNYPQRLNAKTCRKLFGLKWYQIFEYLLPTEKYEKHIELQNKCFEKGHTTYANKIREYTKPNDNIHEVLEKISKKHHQILLSNTEPEALIQFMDLTNIKKYFLPKNYFGIDTHHPESNKTKKETLKKFLQNKKYEQIIIIGDTEADMELKEIGGGTTYLYHYPGTLPKVTNADFIITDLKMVLKEL
jgi:phosphoglycolate phosphatase-like HAD superfamily hydrolase